jgi:2-dehydropantoate 2-reductase
LKVAVLGSGAQGCLYGSFLLKAGHDVTFVARGEQLRALREKGLTVDESRYQVTVVDNPSKIPMCDLGIVAVKARDTASILRESTHLANTGSVFFSVQNAGGKEETMSKFLGKDHVIGAVSMHGAVVTEPAAIKVTSAGRGIAWIGEYPSGASGRVRDIAAALTSAGLRCEPCEEISSVIWVKLIQFSTEAGICSITRLPWYRVLKEPTLGPVVFRALNEGARLAHSAGISLGVFPSLLDIESLTSLPAEETFKELLARGAELEQKGFIHHRPSMLMDILRKKPTEVDDTVGYLVRKAADLEVDVPTIGSIYGFIRGIEASYDLT